MSPLVLSILRLVAALLILQFGTGDMAAAYSSRKSFIPLHNGGRKR